ncbi:MAG: circadian clock protein KaiB [Candidatus Sumerlaeia bacterium]|nr:circadian clock protein KaiB [Candidatus Sumerlaeia bacterium]
MSQDTFSLQLFVSGDSPNSVRAVANLSEVCREHFEGKLPFEVIDLLKDPGRALRDGILFTPTLLVQTPTGTREIIGNLSDKKILLATIGMEGIS